jgi:CBS domain containing-hemolysin-like protein
MGRQPEVGEYIVHMGYKFSIVETDSRRIVKIHIEKQESMQDQLEGLLN